LIVVIGNGGADCSVSFHTKDKNGLWTQQFTTDGDCGYKGITYNKKEGDGKTPAGLYSFMMAFGIKPDPGAKLDYRQVNKFDYWVDDINSPYYNTLVNSQVTPGSFTSEHLIDHSPQYNYVLNINYNPSNTPGLGSAIFLHGYNGKSQTTGCIAISEKYVKALVQEVDSSTRILIVPESDDLTNYE
jgi:L,D-peptidoglycan transpeptidase YkuD (ErfK/YbiS/YcfS/YnhG family)